jgi:hypothetical protein
MFMLSYQVRYHNVSAVFFPEIYKALRLAVLDNNIKIVPVKCQRTLRQKFVAILSIVVNWIIIEIITVIFTVIDFRNFPFLISNYF